MDDAVARVEQKLQAFYDDLPQDEQAVVGAVLALAAGPETQGFAMAPTQHSPTTPVRVLKVANFVVHVPVPNPNHRAPGGGLFN